MNGAAVNICELASGGGGAGMNAAPAIPLRQIAAGEAAVCGDAAAGAGRKLAERAAQ